MFFQRTILLLTLLFTLNSNANDLVTTADSPTQIEITDSHGKYRFSEPPKRVVVLNWALAEQLLELGIEPVGMADIDGFSKHASKPLIPTSTEGVGKRLKPDLLKIKELQPDVILIGYSQRPLIKSLSNIGTVIYFKNFGKRYNNYQKSRERFLELAKLFDKTNDAESRLLKLDDELASLKASLQSHFNQELPSILFTVSDSDKKRNTSREQNHSSTLPRSTWAFGLNSMPYYAANELGLKVVDVGETDKFGVVRLESSALNKWRTVNNSDHASSTASNNQRVCNLEFSSLVNNNSRSTSIDTPTASQCILDLSYQNGFGGTVSVLYLATAIHDALISEFTIK